VAVPPVSDKDPVVEMVCVPGLGVTTLKGAALPVPRRRPVAEAQRRAGVVFGLVLVLGGGAGWAWLELNPPVAPQPVVVTVPREAPAQVVSDDAVEWEALAQLQRSVRLAVASEFREEEVTRRVFGALPGWVAPKKSSPMRSLGRAASPVVYTQEDVP
jgi:hypothetical protein